MRERACKAGALPAELHAHRWLLQSFSITYAATATACAPEILEQLGAGKANPMPTFSASSSRKDKFSLSDFAYSDVMSFPRECPAVLTKNFIRSRLSQGATFKVARVHWILPNPVR